jgi:hypothetical protein
LHNVAKGAFVLAVLLCLIEVLLAVFCKRGGSVMCENAHPTVLFFAAWLPVISAGSYAILTHAEYPKIAEASGEITERIAVLYEKLLKIPGSDAAASPESLAEMAPIVVEFAGIAISEATGWRAMLRDKNVPLG